MLDHRCISRIDYRIIPVIICLMVISLLTISAYSIDNTNEGLEEGFFTPAVIHQVQGFALGIGVFLLFTAFDYNKLREWTWGLYLIMILSLIGLFFTDPIQKVHRWYRIPIVHLSFQPSEYAKLVVVIALSWFLERRRSISTSWSTAFFSCLIVGIPFLLILKQPDLGTALVLCPVAIVMFYFGNVNPLLIKGLTLLGGVSVIFIALIFVGIISHEEARPYVTKFLKEYQFDRLDPNTHHQKAGVTAIAVGGFFGKGWRKAEFAGGGWLPFPYTDSVFPAFGEAFGFLGLLLLLALFYALIYFSFQVSAVASNIFGRLLSAGIAVYLAMHIIINIGMMVGFLPITGVPLILVTYGGSSVLSTMAALGILQSIYSRRFVF